MARSYIGSDSSRSDDREAIDTRDQSSGGLRRVSPPLDAAPTLYDFRGEYHITVKDQKQTRWQLLSHYSCVITTDARAGRERPDTRRRDVHTGPRPRARTESQRVRGRREAVGPGVRLRDGCTRRGHRSRGRTRLAVRGSLGEPSRHSSGSCSRVSRPTRRSLHSVMRSATQPGRGEVSDRFGLRRGAP